MSAGAAQERRRRVESEIEPAWLEWVVRLGNACDERGRVTEVAGLMEADG